MSSKKLSRRTFLRGTAGAAIALPLLETMGAEEAFAQSGEKTRYIVCFGGTSMSSLGASREQAWRPVEQGNLDGVAYDTSQVGLNPLGETYTHPITGEVRRLAEHVSVVSGLRIPCSSDNGGVLPPAGKPDAHHGKMMNPLLRGTRHDSDRGSYYINGVSSDQLFADEFQGQTPVHSLQYRAQAYWKYNSGEREVKLNSTPVATRRRANGDYERLQPQINPMQAFDALFGSFDGPNVDPAQQRHRRFLTQGRRSVVDLVMESYGDLKKKVSASDRLLLDKHLTEIQALQRRIEDLMANQETNVCMPAEPGGTFSESSNWADEDKRAEVLSDLIYMAFACDLTRAATLVFTLHQSFLPTNQINGRDLVVHETGHSAGDPDGVHDIIEWHVKLMSYLIKRLAEAPDGPAKTLLEQTALVMLFEGGYGASPEKGPNAVGPHSTENMAAFIAGGAGGLRGGEHIYAKDHHPGEVLMSAMQATGVQHEKFGDLDWKVLDGLFS